MAGGADVFTEWASQPFQPSHIDDNGAATDVSLRVAVALEYIAAQLGEISRKMDHVGSGFGDEGGFRGDERAFEEAVVGLVSAAGPTR